MPKQSRQSDRLARRNRALEALHSIGLEIGGQLDLKAVLRQIMEHAIKLIDADSGGGLYLYEADSGLLRVAEAVGPSSEHFLGLTLRPGEGLGGRVFTSGKVMAISDYAGWEGRAETFVAPSFRAVMGAPLRWQDQIIGVIDVLSNREGRVFDEDERWLLELFAAQAAIAIGNARLYEAERTARASADALLAASSALSSSLSLPEVLQGILRSCRLVLPFVSGTIMTLVDERPHLSALVGYEGREKVIISRSEAEIKDSPIFKQLIREQHSMIINDVQHHPDWVVYPEARHIRSWMGVPLIAQGRVIGVLSVDSDRTDTYTPEHRRMAEMLGVQAAIAIEHARLFGATQEAESRFRDIAQSLSDWLWEVDHEGRITFCSEQIKRVTGYTIAEVIGRTPLTLPYLHESRPSISRVLALARRKETLSNVEIWLRHKQGYPICIQISGLPILKPDGQIRGYRGIAKDITVQKKVEQRERLAFDLGQKLISVLSLDELLRTFVAQLIHTFGYYHVTSWRYDKTMNHLVISGGVGEYDVATMEKPLIIKLDRKPSLIAKAGRDKQVLVSNDVLNDPEFLFYDRLPDTRSEVALPLLQGDQLLGVLDIHSQDTNAFTPDEVRALQNLAAQATIAIVNARLYERLSEQADLLEELVAERTQEVVRERERLQAIVENAGEGIIFTDARGVVEYANRAWETITGRQAADIIGTRTQDMFTPHLSPDSRVPDFEFVAADVWHGEIHALRPDGSEYDGGLTVAPVTDGEGNLLNLVGVIHDITAQKQIDRMRTKFVANVSHELRTPITTLKLYHMLVSSVPADKQGEYLATMGEQLGRLEKLVEDLLDISRLDRGAVEIHPEEIDLNALVDQVVASHRLRADRRSITVLTDYGRDLPTAWADHPRLTQVLNNLLTNAVNYSADGGVVSIRTWGVRTDGDEWAAFSISDTGMGIGPEDLPFIFDRFFRSETVKESGVPGTGLGLSIVHDIIELHRGTISVDSTPGKGSTFCVRLPVMPSTG